MISSSPSPTKARYLMIGGFLGAGKTTSILTLARHLRDQGRTVGLITNDQGMGLVDTKLGRTHQFPVEEIAGGCFCCRFNSLIDAARELTESTRPDVLIAEPVGSCTDLVATVSFPLRQIYGHDFTVAPFSVVVDPIRALNVLGIETAKSFSPNVIYIYRKQLEEAEIIVVNKSDLLDGPRRDALVDGLRREFPQAEVLVASAREQSGLAPWFDAILSREMNVMGIMEIDYPTYGDGEALLGWLNSTIAIDSGDNDDFDGNAFLQSLATHIQSEMQARDAEVAHLKMTLTPIGDPFEIAAINLVRNDSTPELSHTLLDPLEDGELILNMRAEASPDTLDAITAAAIERTAAQFGNLTTTIQHNEHFRPGMPTPTHNREAAAAGVR
jgi:Ni2+-binding GTPase involved in maturation of urease and hydrogenase